MRVLFLECVFQINSVPTKPIEGQKTGTSGLRKKVFFFLIYLFFIRFFFFSIDLWLGFRERRRGGNEIRGIIYFLLVLDLTGVSGWNGI